MSYTESKKKLDKIRQEYGCKGDVLFRTAIQYVVEFGSCTLQDKDWYKWMMDDIDANHDRAEAKGEILWCTKEFEKAIIDCAVALSKVNTYDFLTYIQREVWLGGGEVGEPDYQRAIEIIRNCLCYTADCYGAYSLDCQETIDKFREMGLKDEEIEYFGWEYLFDVEDEEED
jgi:hypothetical protein